MTRIVGHGSPRIERIALEESPDIDLPPGSRLVDVQWASVNAKDLLIASGGSRVPAEVTGLGIDGVGAVRSPEGARRRVAFIGRGIGEGPHGSFAEQCPVPEADLLEIPDGLESFEAAQFATAGLAGLEAARQVIEHLGDERTSAPVLVTGAGGAVGSAALETLRDAGVACRATTRSRSTAQRLHELGIEPLQTRAGTEDQRPQPLASTDHSAIIDTVGGPQLGHLISALGRGGLALVVGGSAGMRTEISLLPLILRGVEVRGFSTDDLPRHRRQEDLDLFAEIVARRQDGGGLRARLSGPPTVLSLPQALSALQDPADRLPAGRTLIGIHTAASASAADDHHHEKEQT